MSTYVIEDLNREEIVGTIYEKELIRTKHAKYIATTKFNKFSGEIFDANSKQAKLAVNKDQGNVEQCAITSI